jgi:Glycosyl hydrolase family 71
VPDGAEYVANMPHEAWLKFLPHYIAAYKSGNTTMTTTSPDAAEDEAITYWYKLNPGDSGLAGGTTGNNPNQGQPAIPPQLVSQDKVFVSVLVARPSTVSITIGHGSGGGGGQPTLLRANSRGINHFSVPIRGQVGAVRIAVEREGREIVATVGPEITHACRNGRVNWNAYVGSS